MPRIDDLLDILSNSKRYATVDVTSDCWPMCMAEEDIQKMASVTHDSHYEWLVIPFGLRSAPATFQWVVQTMIQKHQLWNALNYFGNIIIHLETKEQHLGTLWQRWNPEVWKCQIKNSPLQTLNPLGRTVCDGKSNPQAKKVVTLRRYLTPKNIKDIEGS